ncbi:MAG TPA: sulfotransferase family 2 domain-containing protein [Xanthobacteraceae bacterium]|nr:sulfotransferase family 2 domain-containing protein [Xanthobacteraceae bacterium]
MATLQTRGGSEAKAGNGSGLGPSAPDLLIHLHIAKTGGTTLSSMVKHAFGPDQVFETMSKDHQVYGGLDLLTYASCERMLRDCDIANIRYFTGHVPIGVDRLFGRPAKYIAVVRHPVERLLSYFYFRIQGGDPYLKDGKPIAFEDYVESGGDIIFNNYQVRVISGSPDLDAPAGPRGALVAGAPVEARHLAMAKRNIEDNFLSIAPIGQIAELALLLRRVYGWPMRRLQTEYKNPTRERPRAPNVAPRLLRIIEERNAHDIALYDWVCQRFAAQRALYEPGLSRDRCVYSLVNRALTTAGEILPWTLRKRLAQILFYARR